ncbi:MAG: lipid-A-disaccharide synthase [Flavobacteriaceae bacterium]
MKYYLLAGEASGDLHGSHLMKALKKEDPNAQFRYWGGDLMAGQGGALVVHYKDRAIMGFTEVLKNLPKISKLFKLCKKDILDFNPDALIFIDNSGFNLRMAKWAKPKGLKTHYYISPQVWASRAGRVKTIIKTIDHMYVVLPFVKDFYKKYNYPVHFVGHPLLDAISDRELVDPNFFRRENNLDERPIIALLPGSRKQEISKMLKGMLSVVADFKDYQFVIAGAPSQEKEFYRPFIKKDNVHLLLNKTYDLLSVSHAALVTSGTATLETALYKVPQVVCYKGGQISYEIAKRIIKLKYISLVNLILDKPVVTELIQNDFTTENLKKELTKILNDYQRAVLFLDYYDLEVALGGKGASEKTAKLIVSSLAM